MALYHSSVIVTGAAVDTRTRDQLVFNFPPRPQTMTIYVRFVELGNILNGGGTIRIFQIGNIAGTAPLLGIETSPSNHRIRFSNGISSAVTSGLAVQPAWGNRVELRGVFTVSSGASPTATAFVGQSINEGVEVTSTPTSALLVPTAWSDTKMSVNSVGAVAGTTGLIALRNIEIVSGVRTMQQMRVIAGTD